MNEKYDMSEAPVHLSADEARAWLSGWNAAQEDRRYQFVTCVCGRDYQWIDFGCAQHRLMCENPTPTER